MGDLIERLRGGKCPECAGWGEVAYFGEMVGCICLGRYEPPITMATRIEAADELTALRERVAVLEAEVSDYRKAEESRQRQGALEWEFVQLHLREEAEKREAGRWSAQ